MTKTTGTMVWELRRFALCFVQEKQKQASNGCHFLQKPTGSNEAHHWKLQCFASGRGHFFGRMVRVPCDDFVATAAVKNKKAGFRWVLLDLESERTGKYCLKTRELSMKAVHFEILNRICTKSVHLVWSTGTSLLLLLPKPGLWQQVSDRHRYNFWLF